MDEKAGIPLFEVEYGQGPVDENGNILAGLNTYKIDGKVVTKDEFDNQISQYKSTLLKRLQKDFQYVAALLEAAEKEKARLRRELKKCKASRESARPSR